MRKRGGQRRRQEDPLRRRPDHSLWRRLAGPICLFCAFTLAGTGVLSARYVSVKLGAFTITAVSLFFALVVLIPPCREKLAGTLRTLSRLDLIFLTAQALFGMFFFRMFLIVGLTYTSAGEAGILTGTAPAVTAILSWTVLKESSGVKKAAGIFCTVAGISLIQGLLLPENGFSGEAQSRIPCNKKTVSSS